MKEGDQEAAPHSKNHKKAMVIAIGIFLLLGIAYFCYWFFWGRFHEYTNDAYVDGNMVIVTPQVPGIVTSFTALSTDFVTKGRILVALDKTDAWIALDQSKAQLANAVREVERMFEDVHALYAAISMKKALFVRAAQDYERRMALIEEGAVSREDFEHAAADVQAAYADLVSTEHSFIAALAQIDGTTPYTHPLVEKAKDQLRDAFVFLQRCTIIAPVTGIVAQRSVQVGEHVKKGQPLLAIVPLDQMWVIANFKEVQLGKMRIGQSVKVTSDIYGGRVVFDGTVVGIGGGTGAVFSVLPPQNATGNWIKIVQRIPVKIDVPADMLAKYPLRLGLSMEATVNLYAVDLPMVPSPKPPEPLYSTDVFARQEEGAEELIVKIIAENLSEHFLEDMSSSEEE
ncbi:MAG TPA: efflux RND transporter periplasmic adaptor subunit [Rhabdochlamydiaceae bacterium]